jgi:flagellar assembly factor FliW
MINADYRDDQAERRVHLTTVLGEFDVDPRDVLRFPDGLPGFERSRQFVLLSAPGLAPLQCLHSIEDRPASFLAIDPRLVLPRYRCVLSEGDRARLGVKDDSTLLWLALVTMVDDTEATVNLRAPIVVNPARMVGFQVLPYNSLYPLRHPLALE